MKELDAKRAKTMKNIALGLCLASYLVSFAAAFALAPKKIMATLPAVYIGSAVLIFSGTLMLFFAERFLNFQNKSVWFGRRSLIGNNNKPFTDFTAFYVRITGYMMLLGSVLFNFIPLFISY